MDSLFRGIPASTLSRTGRFWVYGILMAVSFVAYANTLPNELIFDDKPVILHNPLIHDLSSLSTAFVRPYWTHGESHIYRPFTLASFALSRAIGGYEPSGYHALNIFLHGLVAICLYVLGTRLGLSQTGNFLSAAIFAVHPLHSEAVGPIVGRAELLMSLGTLLSLILYIDSWRESARKPIYVLGSLGFFVLALLSKEQAMILPFLLILYDLSRPRIPGTSRRRQWQQCVLRYSGYFLILGLLLTVRQAVLGTALYDAGNRVSFLDNPLAHLDWISRLPGAISVAGRYLGLFLWPQHLSADYSYNAISVPVSFWAPAPLVMILVIGAFGYLAARSYLSGERRVFFAIGFTSLTFAPAANILVPIGTLMGERLFYLPSAGLCLLAAIAFDCLVARVHPAQMRNRVFVSIILMVALLCSALVRTVYRNRDWRDSESLAMSGLATFPTSAKLHTGLAAIHLKRGDFAEALKAYQTAILIYPDYPRRHWKFAKNMGSVLLKLGNSDEAIRYLKRAIQLNPNYVAAHYNLGYAYLSTRAWTQAAAHFSKVLELDPTRANARKGLAIAEAEKRKEARGAKE